MLRVLLDVSVLATRTTTRGIGRYAADLARSLNRVAETSAIELWAVEALPWLGRAVLTRDVAGAVERLGAQPQRLAHARWAYQLRLGLARAADQARADLLHCPHPNATPLGQLPCARVVTCHDLIPLRYPEHHTDWRDGFRAGRLRLDRRRFGSADGILAISHTTERDLRELLHLDPARIRVVYNGIDLSRFSPEPAADDPALLRRFQVMPRGYVLAVGAANWRKNSDNIVRALSHVALGPRSLKLPRELVWAGRLGIEDAARVRRAAAEARVSDQLKLAGYVSDAELGALYRHAAALVFVSRAEGFGYPLLEAMASGCPVVTSNQSSLREIAGEAALMVDPENPLAIGEAIRVLCTRETSRAELVREGLGRAKSFSLARMAEGTVASYHAFAEAHRTPKLG